MKLFSETVNKNPNDPNSEKVNEYDQKVPAKEVEEFEEDIVEKIYAKAEEFGISKEELNNLNNNLDSLITELKENIKLDKERKVIEFEENLKKEIKEKALESGKTEEEIANDETIKKLEKKLQAEKETIEHAKNDIFHKAAFYNSDDLEKDIKEKAEEFGMSEENLKDVMETVRESEFEKGIKESSKTLKISKDVFYKLAGFNLNELKTDLNDEKNSDSELFKKSFQRGEFKFWKEDLYRGLNDIQRDEKTKDLKEKKLSKFERFVESIKKHKKVVSSGELLLYLSSYGAPALNFLVDSDVKVEIGDKKILLEDLADDPELIKKNKNINAAYADLCGLQEIYDATTNKNFEHNGYILSIDSEIHLSFNDEESKKLVHISFEPDNEMKVKVSDKMLRDIDNISQVEFRGTPSIAITEMTVDEFLENKEKVIDIISENLNAPRDEVKNYVENIYISDISDISVLNFNDFEINKEMDNPKFENLKTVEASDYNYEDMDKFKDLFLDILKEEYTIEELKEIAEDNPEKVILIISEVINKNLKYDDDEWEKMKSGDWSEEDEKTPYEALSNGKAICYAYSSIFISAKHILEEEIPHFKKFVALSDGGGGHTWIKIATANQKGNLDVSHIDLTDADAESLSKLFDSKLTKEKLSASGEEFNSKYAEYVDEDQKENKEEIGDEEEIEEEKEAEQKEEHKTTFLEKIKNYKLICVQEKLKKILTQYDPKLHKKEQEIKMDKEASGLIAKKKKESSREGKENAINSLP